MRSYFERVRYETAEIAATNQVLAEAYGLKNGCLSERIKE